MEQVPETHMNCYGVFLPDQVPAITREKIRDAGGKCYQHYCEDMGDHEPPVWLYLPDGTRMMPYGYLLPGDVPLYVESYYEIYHGLIRDERIIVLSLR